MTVPLDATLIDIGNAHVFIRAADVGLKGTETAAETDADMELRARLDDASTAEIRQFLQRLLSEHDDLEVVAALTPRFDVERLGARRSEDRVKLPTGHAWHHQIAQNEVERFVPSEQALERRVEILTRWRQ